MQSSKWIITPVAVAVAVLSACAHNANTAKNVCGIMSDKPPPAPTEEAIANSGCIVGPDMVILSAVFDGDKPVRVGGGVDARTGNRNDKKVKGGQEICWVATDMQGNPSNQKFEILFSPSKEPKPNQNYQSVKIFKKAPSGLEYKYTIWASREECGFLDPRFLVD